MKIFLRQMKYFTLLLLMAQVCHPFAEAFTEFSSESVSYGIVCSHAAADRDHAPQNGRQHDLICHEDAPCDTAPELVLNLPSVIRGATPTYEGSLQDGYHIPIDIPPENHYPFRGRPSTSNICSIT